MKKISNVKIYDRLYLIPIISSLKGNAKEIHSGVRLLQKLSMPEEDQKAVGLVFDDKGNYRWSKELESFDLVLEDDDYKFLMTIFDKKDENKEWEMGLQISEMIKRFRSPEDLG